MKTRKLKYDEIPWIDPHPGCEYSGPAVDMDFGIGENEYWGNRQVHHDWQWVCPGCGMEVEP